MDQNCSPNRIKFDGFAKQTEKELIQCKLYVAFHKSGVTAIEYGPIAALSRRCALLQWRRRGALQVSGTLVAAF
jgi:hypothetical protein